MVLLVSPGDQNFECPVVVRATGLEARCLANGVRRTRVRLDLVLANLYFVWGILVRLDHRQEPAICPEAEQPMIFQKLDQFLGKFNLTKTGAKNLWIALSPLVRTAFQDVVRERLPKNFRLRPGEELEIRYLAIKPCEDTLIF